MPELQYRKLLAAGGIGFGILFQLADNRPLGRTESRSAVLTDLRDYCKAHIITHYAARCLGPSFETAVVGAVGADTQGARLLQEMEEAGITTRWVAQRKEPTMQSVCIQYADGSVCNVTSSNGASGQVTERDVLAAAAEASLDEKSMVLAVPEVPLEARTALLEAGTEAGARRIASFTAEEADDFRNMGGPKLCDLIVVNEEEAEAFAGKRDGDEARMEAFVEAVRKEGSGADLIMTCGERGALAVQGDTLAKVEALPVRVAATGGAGDAFLAGVLCGTALGIPLISPDGRPRALRIGQILAARSVECPHTIVPDIGPADLLRGIQEPGDSKGE